VSKSFTIQAGGGIDEGLTPRVAIRAQGGPRFLTGGEGTTQLRFASGVVFVIRARQSATSSVDNPAGRL